MIRMQFVKNGSKNSVADQKMNDHKYILIMILFNERLHFIFYFCELAKYLLNSLTHRIAQVFIFHGMLSAISA